MSSYDVFRSLVPFFRPQAELRRKAANVLWKCEVGGSNAPRGAFATASSAARCRTATTPLQRWRHKPLSPKLLRSGDSSGHFEDWPTRHWSGFMGAQAADVFGFGLQRRTHRVFKVQRQPGSSEASGTWPAWREEGSVPNPTTACRAPAPPRRRFCACCGLSARLPKSCRRRTL